MVFLCLAPYVQTGVGVRFGSDKKPEILDANHDITHWLTLFVDDFAHGMHAAVQGDGTHVCTRCSSCSPTAQARQTECERK